MTFLLAFGLAAAGLGTCALAMHRHWSDLFGPEGKPPVLPLRGASACLLAASLGTSISLWGPSIGATAWFGLLSLAGLLLVLALAAWGRTADRSGLKHRRCRP